MTGGAGAWCKGLVERLWSRGPHPLRENRAAAPQCSRPSSLRHEGQRHGGAGEAQEGVHLVHEQLVEQAERAYDGAIIELDLIAFGAGLAAQLEERLAAQAGEDGGGQEGEEAVREDGVGLEAPSGLSPSRKRPKPRPGSGSTDQGPAMSASLAVTGSSRSSSWV